MEVRLEFTIAEHGHEPENGERFMEGFMAVFPEGGPSVSQNLRGGTLTVTFALDAADAKEAVSAGIEIFGRGAAASGLPPTDVLDVEASVVPAEEPDEAPEPVLA